MKTTVIVALIVISFIGFYMYAQKKSPPSNSSLSISTIQTDIASGGQLIDVRTAEEYKTSHIDGAINLSLQDIEQGTLPTAQKDKPVYVYCRSGSRSGQATMRLKAAGYQNIIDLGAMTHVQSIGGSIRN